MPEEKATRSLPLLPLRDIIVFPHMVVPLFVGREKSIHSLKEAYVNGKDILLTAQRDADTNDPTPDDLFEVGTIGTIIQLLDLPDGTVKVLIEGKYRARICQYLETEQLFIVEVAQIEEQITEAAQQIAPKLQSHFEIYVSLNKRIPPEMQVAVSAIRDPAKLADTLVAHLNLKLSEKQALLENDDVADRLSFLLSCMQSEIEILQIEKRIHAKTKRQAEKQREYSLNEQMQAFQKELGERDEFKNEIQELEELIQKKSMSPEATQKTQKELRKLRQMSPMSAEAAVVRNYVDTILSLPWNERTEDCHDIARATQVLDEDHYGLEKPKERILEYLAVNELVEHLRGPILCLVGPPGVGKTSLGQSIARATQRNFVRISLGGVHDEAEIRGHRKTYIGAMPGKIIQGLKKAGSNNPVMLLDEIDKLSADYHGDPSSALLEVLDPEQNSTFQDHFLDIDYDLSQVLFVTTANSRQQIPAPLQDRLEIIEISGYTEFEKQKIAERHLIPKETERNGIQNLKLTWQPSAIELLIRRYTHESGVRGLEREIASLCRKIAKEAVLARKAGKPLEQFELKITPKEVQKRLGSPKYRYGMPEETDSVGLVNGLAFTSWGGDLLQAEVALMPGKGNLVLTGQLGDVMQESARAAMTYVRSRSKDLGLAEDFYQTSDVHIHFPQGGIPKDGPSAGVTIATAIVSAFCQIPVRRDIAMTGEITLRGRVLPIGGLKEKTLAARRAGISTVIIPEENRKDLEDIPPQVRKTINFECVSQVDQVLELALKCPPSILWKGRSACEAPSNSPKTTD